MLRSNSRAIQFTEEVCKFRCEKTIKVANVWSFHATAARYLFEIFGIILISVVREGNKLHDGIYFCQTKISYFGGF